MTDQTAQEPTMEEILASIRRIISEDEAPAETAATAEAPAAETEPQPAAEVEAVSPALMDQTPSVQEPVSSDEDVLDLTDRYEAPAAETIGDLDVAPAPEPESTPEPFPEAPMVSEPAFEPQAEAYTPEPSYPAPGGDTLVGTAAASTAASAFAGLAASLRRPEPTEMSSAAGPTIDELARQLLRPMLKDWLDANLPAIVEAQVRKEVERIARNAG
jgi:cell pole-organizing protein PopZ